MNKKGLTYNVDIFYIIRRFCILWMKKFRLYGGDLRIVRLIEILASENHTVFIYGQEKYFENSKKSNKIFICDCLEECINQSDLIISGVPVSKDNVTIYSPFSKEIIRLDKVYEYLNGKTFIAGNIPINFYKRDTKLIRNIDLLQIEELTVLNAIPTVEGIIKIAIEETEITIHESNILILGFGRIGKMVCKRFQALGANIYCATKQQSDLSWIRESRYNPVKYEELNNYVDNMNYIINTIPSKVITESIIKKLNKECVIIDIASYPGGVDKEAAQRYNIKVVTALGIPGKIAPKTAAKYIKHVVTNISSSNYRSNG